MQEQQALQRVSSVPQVALNHMLESECNGHTVIQKFDACFCRQIFWDSKIHLHKLQSRYVCTSAAPLAPVSESDCPPHKYIT